jgi:anti-sigma factor RsiW
MNCSRELLEGYLDEELDLVLKAEVEEHLAGCRSCSDAYSQIRERQAMIRAHAPYYDASPQLRQSVLDAVRLAAGKPDSPGRNVPWRWLAIAASVLLAFSLAWNFSQLRTRMPQREVLAENILSSHVRSLIGTHLLDVVSSDQHTVKPWFNGKLDFAPVVKDFAPQGFPLIGGRIEYLSGRNVAALIYQRRKHVINLFTWPSTSSDAKESRFSRNGYHVIQWSDPSMTYWAVSDVAATDLQQFKELYTK